MPPDRLTPHNVDSAAPRARAFKLSDGNGVFLLVTPEGGKYWRLKYRFGGRENSLSLGVYPAVSVDAARRMAARIRAQIAEGVDPSQHRKAERHATLIEHAQVTQPPRFSLDDQGALSYRVGSKVVVLTAAETAQLRAFLDATRDVAMPTHGREHHATDGSCRS